MIVHTISFQKPPIRVEAQFLVPLEVVLHAFLDAAFLLGGVEVVLGIDAGLEAEVSDLVDGHG